jgi:integrase
MAVQPRLQIVQRQTEPTVGGARNNYDRFMYHTKFEEGSWGDLTWRWLQALERRGGLEGRGCSGATLMGNYLPSAQRFMAWTEVEGIEPEQWSQQDFEAYSDHMAMQPGLSKASKKTYMRPIQGLLNWCHKHDLLKTKTKIDGLFSRKGNARKVTPLSREDLKVLYHLELSPRDRLVLRVLAETGMRGGELRTIVPKGIHDVNGRWVIDVTDERFPIKNKKHGRSVPVPSIPGEKPLGRQLLDYARTHLDPEMLNWDEQAILRTSRAPFNPLNEDQVYNIIHKIELTASLRSPHKLPHLFPHLFRHTLITDLLRVSNDRHDVSRWLGTGVDQIENTYSHLLATDNTDKLDQVGALRR